MGVLDFLKPKWKHPEAEIRKLAIINLDDEKVLAKLSESDADRGVRRLAHVRISGEQQVLLTIAKLDPVWEVRLWAVSQLREQTFLAEIVRTHPEYEIREEAVSHINNIPIIEELLKTDISELVQERLDYLKINPHIATDTILDVIPENETELDQENIDQEMDQTESESEPEPGSEPQEDDDEHGDGSEHDVHEIIKQVGPRGKINREKIEPLTPTDALTNSLTSRPASEAAESKTELVPSDAREIGTISLSQADPEQKGHSRAPDQNGVYFIKEYSQMDLDGTRLYKIFGGPSEDAAISFLDQNPVNEADLYIVVKTREGVYFRDSEGIFREDSDDSPTS